MSPLWTEEHNTEIYRKITLMYEHVQYDFVNVDIKTMSPQQFDQYRCAVERVLKEQISNVAKFNLYR